MVRPSVHRVMQPVLGHEVRENTFAQSPVGDTEALAWPHPEQRLEYGASRQH
jgi:hypothetical protein